MSGPLTLTTREAAATYGMHATHIADLARRGRIDAVQVDGVWLVDGASLEAHIARRRRNSWVNVPRLPAAPLLHLVALRGGAAACGVRQKSREQKSLERARANGWLTDRAADELTVRLLGLTPMEVWGDPAA